MSRTLLVQFARLGDLVQSLPVISSLHIRNPHQKIDLLCAEPLVSLGQLFPGIQRVYSWQGEQWHSLGAMPSLDGQLPLKAAVEYLKDCAYPEYSLAYNLNNHPRSILAAHLLSAQIIGAGERGPLNPGLPPWVAYLRQVAHERGQNRIHLADAFCGICGVTPTKGIPVLEAKDVVVPRGLECLVKDESVIQIGIVLGAGDADRRVPLSVWQEFIQLCTERIPHCRILLIGGSGERETSLILEQNLLSHMRNQVINCCSRTSLPQLVSLLNHCQWVIGSDTGPLHLGVMCGARAIGWYFSRARVHETGPYGEGHWVWQAERHQQASYAMAKDNSRVEPDQWPVKGSVDLMAKGNCQTASEGWSLWESHRDQLGVFFSETGKPAIPNMSRERIWRQLGDETAREWNSTLKAFEGIDSQRSMPV